MFSILLLSALLLSVFTVYIALGVLGLYAKRPCGCASVFSGLSWGGHIGDKYEGLKQRIFTEEDYNSLMNLINDFKQKYSSKINSSSYHYRKSW